MPGMEMLHRVVDDAGVQLDAFNRPLPKGWDSCATAQALSQRLLEYGAKGRRTRIKRHIMRINIDPKRVQSRKEVRVKDGAGGADACG